MNAAASPARLKPGSQPLRPAEAIRVMLIDDSLTVRTIFKRMIGSDPQMVIAGTASSAERGIAQLVDADADVILLDLEMPGMGGLEALPKILRTAPAAQVMVVSSLTEDGAEETIEALSRGAADTMLKPRPGGFNDEYRITLLDKIRALGAPESASDGNASEAGSTAANAPAQPHQHRRTKTPQVLAIGASTGGIHALNILLRQLNDDFDLPILITQHLPSSFIPVFARQIEVASGRTTRIADDGTEIGRGEIAIATGHGHMNVRRVGDSLVTRISAEPTSSGCLPSVDPMLASLSDACDGHAIAVILSGMGRDGFDGASVLSAAGGTVWAQDADTSAVWGMPGAVAKAGLTSYVASPEALGSALVSEFIKSWQPARDQVLS